MPSILALDPGFCACGWAVVASGAILAAGCIRTEPSARKGAVRVADDDAARCQYLARGLKTLIDQYDASGIVAEMPSAGGKGARAVTCMARAGTIVAVVAELMGLPAEWVTPAEVKKVAGAKNSSKEDVEIAVLERWPDAPLPTLKAEREHTADALGAYLAAEHGTLVRLLTVRRQTCE